MEDKQIYTTARSEEIKRKLISLKKELFQKYNDFNKDRRSKVTVKKAETQKETQAPASKKAKSQNVQIKLEAEDIEKAKVINTKTNSSPKDSLPFISEERLFQIATFTIFGFIILIIAIGIYLTYKN